MDHASLIAQYPTVYHMADAQAWASIQRHGLLPTRDLVDLFEPDAATRASLLHGVRSRSVSLHHDRHGTVTIRDQGPLKFLPECLTDEATPQQYLDALNARVYFWGSLERLGRLLGARRYRSSPQVVLHVDTDRLVARHGAAIELAPYNTGSLHVPTLPKRGADVFQPITDYPHDEWRRRRGKGGDALVEVTVVGPVSDIVEITDTVDLWVDGRPTRELYRR